MESWREELYAELYHHGIKGQRWGVRRFQNPDGTLTEEGRKRYGSLESLRKEGRLLLSHDFTKPESFNKIDMTRAKESIDLGLKALNKMGFEGFDPKKGITGDDRRWFVFEDQTIGHLAIADLVNQGFSKNEILKFIDEANNKFEEKANSRNFNGIYDYFDLKEFHNNGFIDACIEIKKQNN